MLLVSWLTLLRWATLVALTQRTESVSSTKTAKESLMLVPPKELLAWKSPRPWLAFALETSSSSSVADRSSLGSLGTVWVSPQKRACST